jgi:hypothetical protein
MKNNRLKTVFFTITFFILIILADTSVRSQTARPAPELCAAGFCLGDNEEAVKAKLQGYSPRYDNQLHQPKYFFYNEYGNQVMSLTAHSKERPFLLVGIEVFAVDDSYTTKHFQMKDTAAFTTESGFFIGLRPSASSMIFGVPNSSGPKEVIKKKGQPDTDEKPEKLRILRYKFSELKKLETPEANSNRVNSGSYTAEYRFYKNSLRHVIFAVEGTL